MLDALGEHDIGSWHRQYAKEYRDALAHRIAPYVPPVELTKEEVARNLQLQLGTASPFFSHDINPDEEGKWVVLHGQLLCRFFLNS